MISMDNEGRTKDAIIEDHNMESPCIFHVSAKWSIISMVEIIRVKRGEK